MSGLRFSNVEKNQRGAADFNIFVLTGAGDRPPLSGPISILELAMQEEWNGKTGFRVANTMPAAVSVYDRIKQRHTGAGPDDYLFFPDYENRKTASKIVQRQFREVMKRAGVEDDPSAKIKYTIYSLRHTAICMRLVLSHGQVNIYNLAKNAGTSVEQIERFYAKRLPLSREMAINLQQFGDQG